MQISELKDVYACCDFFNDAVNLGFDTTSNTYDDYIFNWKAVNPNPNYFQEIGDGEQISTVPIFNGPALANSTFSVNVRDNYGCSSTQETKLWLIDDFNINIEELSDLQDCCSKTYRVNIEYLNGCAGEEPPQELIDELFDITWSTGQTGETISVSDNFSQNISATVTNRCGVDKTDVILHTPVSTAGLNYVENFIAANTFFPSSNNNLNNKLIIYSFGNNVPAIGNTTDDAYGINWYELVIWDRDGHVLKTISKHVKETENCFFTQGEIQWDGTDENGHLVADGTYQYYLNIKTCSNINPQKVCTIKTNKLCKTKCWRWEWNLFIPYKDWYCCEEYEQGAEGNLGNDNQCIYHVQILN